AGILPLRLVLVDARDVESGKEVHVGETGASQPGQVASAVRVEGEGAERAPLRRRHAWVGGAEVAHVQLVEDDVFRGGEGRLAQRPPARRLQRRGGEVYDLAAPAVLGEVDRVGIRDQVVLDLSRRAHEDLDLVLVVATVPGRRAGGGPDPGGRVRRHV